MSPTSRLATLELPHLFNHQASFNENASSEDVSDEALGGVANRIRTGDIQNHNLATIQETPEKQGEFERPTLRLHQCLHQSDETRPQRQAEGGGRKARKRAKADSVLSAEQVSLKVRTADESQGAAKAQTPAPIDFAAAVAGIFALPLSDAEKAEAVRRLLAGGRGR